jgi:hypothetical protein
MSLNTNANKVQRMSKPQHKTIFSLSRDLIEECLCSCLHHHDLWALVCTCVEFARMLSLCLNGTKSPTSALLHLTDLDVSLNFSFAIDMCNFKRLRTVHFGSIGSSFDLTCHTAGHHLPVVLPAGLCELSLEMNRFITTTWLMSATTMCTVLEKIVLGSVFGV